MLLAGVSDVIDEFDAVPDRVFSLHSVIVSRDLLHDAYIQLRPVVRTRRTSIWSPGRPAHPKRAIIPLQPIDIPVDHGRC